MDKRTKKDKILQDISSALKKKPMTINELAETIDLNWTTVRDNLKILENLGLVNFEHEKSKKIYFVKEDLTIKVKRSNTFFGLPISSEQEKIFNTLFSKTRELWVKVTGKEPGKTKVYKTAVEAIKELGLEVPYGWYKFGEVCLMTYEPEKEYVPEIQIPKIDSVIERIIEKFKTMNTLELEIYCYSKNSLYKSSLEIRKKLIECGGNIKNLEGLQKDLYTFLFSMKKGVYDEETFDLVRDFVIITSFLVNSKKNALPQIILAFETIWSLIAIFNFMYSLEKEFGYSRKMLEEYMKDKILSAKEECNCILSDLSELMKESLSSNEKGFSQGKLKGKLKEIDREEVFEEFAEKISKH